jgi:hypothetical protein
MKTILTKEEKTRQEERRILFNQTKREAQIKKGKTINLVERIFSEPFQYLAFEETNGLRLKKFPYFRKQDLILRINTSCDNYFMSNEYKYLHKLEEIQTEYEKMFDKTLKRVD